MRLKKGMERWHRSPETYHVPRSISEAEQIHVARDQFSQDGKYHIPEDLCKTTFPTYSEDKHFESTHPPYSVQTPREPTTITAGRVWVPHRLSWRCARQCASNATQQHSLGMTRTILTQANSGHKNSATVVVAAVVATNVMLFLCTISIGGTSVN